MIQVDEGDAEQRNASHFAGFHRLQTFLFHTHRLLTLRIFTLALLYVGNIAFTFGAEVDIVVTALKSQTTWWSERDSGLLIAFSSGFYAVGTLCMGVLADKIGGKTTFCATLIISGALNMLTALGHSAAFVLAIQALNIIIGAAAWSSMTNIVSHWFEVDQLAMVFSIISTSDELGEFLVDIAEGSLLDEGIIGWAGMFLFQGGFAIAVGLILVFTLSGRKPVALDSPGAADTVVPVERAEISSMQGINLPDPFEGDDELAREVGWMDCLSTFASKFHFWLILGAVICMTILSEFEDWFPTFYQEVFGASPGSASKASSWVGLGASLALLGGLFYDLLGWKSDLGVMLLLNLATTFCVTFLFIYIQSGYQDLTTAAAIGGVYGFVSALPYYLPSSIYSVKFGGKHFSGTLYGFFDAVGYVPGIALDLWAGEITTAVGWGQMLGALIVFALLATIFLACYQWTTRPRSAMFYPWDVLHSQKKDTTLCLAESDRSDLDSMTPMLI